MCRYYFNTKLYISGVLWIFSLRNIEIHLKTILTSHQTEESFSCRPVGFMLSMKKEKTQSIGSGKLKIHQNKTESVNK